MPFININIMNLIKEHYDRLYENSIKQIKENNFFIVNKINLFFESDILIRFILKNQLF